jgi:hypothetical protein
MLRARVSSFRRAERASVPRALLVHTARNPPSIHPHLNKLQRAAALPCRRERMVLPWIAPRPLTKWWLLKDHPQQQKRAGAVGEKKRAPYSPPSAGAGRGIENHGSAVDGGGSSRDGGSYECSRAGRAGGTARKSGKRRKRGGRLAHALTLPFTLVYSLWYELLDTLRWNTLYFSLRSSLFRRQARTPSLVLCALLHWLLLCALLPSRRCVGVLLPLLLLSTQHAHINATLPPDTTAVLPLPTESDSLPPTLPNMCEPPHSSITEPCPPPVTSEPSSMAGRGGVLRRWLTTVLGSWLWPVSTLWQASSVPTCTSECGRASHLAEEGGGNKFADDNLLSELRSLIDANLRSACSPPVQSPLLVCAPGLPVLCALHLVLFIKQVISPGLWDRVGMLVWQVLHRHLDGRCTEKEGKAVSRSGIAFGCFWFTLLRKEPSY